MDNQQDAREGVTLDVMAERLGRCVPFGNYVDCHDVLGFAFTGLPPGPVRDTTLATLLARLGRPVDRQGDGEVSETYWKGDVSLVGPVDGMNQKHPDGSYFRLVAMHGDEKRHQILFSRGAAEVLRDELIGALEKVGRGQTTPPAPAGLVEAVRAVVGSARNGWPGDSIVPRDLIAALDAALSAQAGAAPGVGEDGDEAEADPAFSNGVTHAIKILARAVGCQDWQIRDGSEDRDTDIGDTILGVLTGAGLYDDETGHWARLASQPGGGPVAAGEADLRPGLKAAVLIAENAHRDVTGRSAWDDGMRDMAVRICIGLRAALGASSGGEGSRG